MCSPQIAYFCLKFIRESTTTLLPLGEPFPVPLVIHRKVLWAQWSGCLWSQCVPRPPVASILGVTVSSFLSTCCSPQQPDPFKSVLHVCFPLLRMPFYPSAYPCAHIRACVRACVGAYMQALPCSSEVDVRVFLNCSLPYLLTHGLSLNLELTNSTTVTGQWASPSSYCPASLIIGLKIYTIFGFLCGC